VRVYIARFEKIGDCSDGEKERRGVNDQEPREKLGRGGKRLTFRQASRFAQGSREYQVEFQSVTS